MALMLLGALSTGTARAQEPGTHVSPPEAMEFFRTARERYREGRYPEAAADLERALALDPASPTLAYNLGRVYELMGELPRALGHYRRYLELLPADQADERERTEGTIQRLEGAIASGSVEEEPAPQAEPLRELRGSVVIRERGVADEAFWITLGGGAAVVVGAIVTGALALERAGARDGLVLRDPSQYEAHRAAYASADADAGTLGLVTDVLIGVGGAALVASVLLFVLRENVTERPAEPALAWLPFVAAGHDGVLVGVGGAF
jgi:tetratricopeptide (TPR) repeat protein